VLEESWEYIRDWGVRWRSWLRHCTASREVAGSIPDDVIGIFHWHNPSDRTMTLGLNQPLIEMSTRCVWPTTLQPSCADCLEIWGPQPPGTLWACLGLYRDCFTFYTRDWCASLIAGSQRWEISLGSLAANGSIILKWILKKGIGM